VGRGMTRMKEGRKTLRRRFLRGDANRNHASASAPPAASPDLLAIMERFGQAISLVVVSHRSLAAQASADAGDEEETLRQSIRLLKDVYNEIDFASGVMMRKSR
jgi:hypothetical protein